MTVNMRCVWGALLGALVSGASLAGESPAAGAGRVIINEDSVWRCHFTWEETAPPPEEWTAVEYDDSAWARWSIGRKHHEYFAYGVADEGAFSSSVTLLCMRGKFTVADPAVAGLKLTCSYRGGMVVYVNGKEVARNHLPKDAGPKTPAEKYPPEAFFLQDGQPYLARGGQMSQLKERIKVRIRQLQDIVIPASALKKGTNIVALEIHAAPMEAKVVQKHGANYPCLWNTGGPINVTLAGDGAAPNTSPPRGLRVWNAGTMERFTPRSWADPLEPLKPVRITGTRNGAFCGQVVVGSDAPIKGLKAEIGGLKAADGKAEIPVSAVSISYLRPLANQWYGDFFDIMDDDPAGNATNVQPVWLKVRVTADTVPGDYRGTLTIRADGATAIQVPIELRVVGWKLPDPRDYATTTALVQSPETVALQYKVPMWSDEHFKLMEKSYQLLSEVGNKFVWVPLIARTNYGNEETWIRWVKQPGEGYKYDFAAFDKYMDLVQKHLRPEVVCFYLWDGRAGSMGKVSRVQEEREGVQVSVLDPATGKLELSDKVRYSAPEAQAFWTPVLKEIRDRMEKRGLLGATMFGMCNDWTRPNAQAKAIVNGVFPDAKWVQMSHPRNEHAMIGYNAAVYISMFPFPQPWDAKRITGWQGRQKTGVFPRWGGPATQNSLSLNSPAMLYRIYTEAAQLAGMGGLGHTGADFWQVLTPPDKEGWKKAGWKNKRYNSVVARFPEADWNQLNMDCGTEEILAPGPQGAMSTARFENLREGVQECEARIFIEKAIVGGRLDAALAQKCKDVLDERQRVLRTACDPKHPWAGPAGGFQWYAGTGSEGLAGKLFAAAAEAAAATGGRP